MNTTPLPAGELIDQRGRAELEFLQALRSGLAPLRNRVRATVQQSGTLEAPFIGIEDLRERVDGVLAGNVDHRTVGAVLRWSRQVATPRAVAAFERRREVLAPLAAPAGAVVETAERPPRYWDYEFHATAGGWDGHPDMGFVHHEMIYHFLLEKIYPGDLFAQRRQVAAAAPRHDYERIVDMGCGTGQYTLELAKVYPKAEITAVDMSRTQARYALRRAENAGVQLTVVNANAEATGLPDRCADLVTAFILHHEMPPHATRNTFAEAFRLLSPGGHIHFADVAPYHQRSRFQAWLDDWDAEHGNEPWRRTAATLDLEEAARAAGFVDIEQRALGADAYPWVLTATKPTQEQST
jgi:ubiquinone/menaquinone biosynthesis C-methylase UbiE